MAVLPRVVTRILRAVCMCAIILTLASSRSSAQARPTPPSDSFVDVNGVRLAYLDWGGTGAPIVLLHGFFDSPHWYDRLAPELAKHFRVVALARRGHYKSERQGPYDTKTLTEDLRQFMTKLGFARATIIGWSMAVQEMNGLAIDHPNMVDRLVYLDAAVDWGRALGARLSTDPVGLMKWTDVWPSYDDYRASIVAKIYPGAVPEGGDEQIRATVRQLPDGRVETVANSTVWKGVEAGQLLWRPRFEHIRAPSLVIYAERWYPASGYPRDLQFQVDEWENKYNRPFMAAQRATVARDLRNAKIIQIPGTTHAGLILQAHSRILQEILDFLLPSGREEKWY